MAQPWTKDEETALTMALKELESNPNGNARSFIKTLRTLGNTRANNAVYARLACTAGSEKYGPFPEGFLSQLYRLTPRHKNGNGHHKEPVEHDLTIPAYAKHGEEAPPLLDADQLLIARVRHVILGAELKLYDERSAFGQVRELLKEA